MEGGGEENENVTSGGRYERGGKNKKGRVKDLDEARDKKRDPGKGQGH